MQKIITIFGGKCVLGKYIVWNLAKSGHLINLIKSENEELEYMKTYGLTGQITITKAHEKDYNALTKLVKISDVVINLSCDKPNKNSGTKLFLSNILSEYCFKFGDKKYIQTISIQDYDYKVIEETISQNIKSNASIIKIGDVFCQENEIISSIISLKNAPLIPIALSSKASNIFITDAKNAADAIENIIDSKSSDNQILTLVNGKILKIELIKMIISELKSNARLMFIPDCIAKIKLFFLNLIPGKMLLSFAKLLEPNQKNENIEVKSDFENLGIKQNSIENIIKNSCEYTDLQYLKNIQS